MQCQTYWTYEILSFNSIHRICIPTIFLSFLYGLPQLSCIFIRIILNNLSTLSNMVNIIKVVNDEDVNWTFKKVIFDVNRRIFIYFTITQLNIFKGRGSSKSYRGDYM